MQVVNSGEKAIWSFTALQTTGVLTGGDSWVTILDSLADYGDIAPLTVPGQMVAAIAMLLGYSMIIIPTGIFAMEIVHTMQKSPTSM